MENVLTTILSYSIVPTLITLVITKITEGKIKSSFDKKLEDTKKEHSIEISKFQTEINTLKTRENFRFTKLHEERFEVLKATYGFLNKTTIDLALYVTPIKYFKDEKAYEENEDRLNENFRNSHEEFVKYFRDNLIFFNEKLEALLADFFEEAFQIFADYDAKHQLKKIGEKDKEVTLKAHNAINRFNENIHPINKKIKEEFREILGINL